MKAVIAGGTGFIGKKLTEELISHGYDVYILTRNIENKKAMKPIHYVQWLTEGSRPENELNHADLFINLAGESLSSGRWTEKRKKQILNSRITATREMIRIMKTMDQKPSVFVNASAIGIYPVSENDAFTESTTSAGRGFLSSVVNVWEQEAIEADKLGIRTVLTRFGIVLSAEEGALPGISLPYKLGAGGKIGSGRQWMSWIHIKDAVRAIQFAAETKTIEGPVNITAPHPVRMNDLGKTLAQLLGRPHWLFVPEPVLKLVLGEMSTLIVDGQKVLPNKLLKNSFRFEFPLVRGALADLYER